jgi:hypothetical protein
MASDGREANSPFRIIPYQGKSKKVKGKSEEGNS